MPGEKKAAAKRTKSAAPQAMEVVLEDSINIVRMTKLTVFSGDDCSLVVRGHPT